MGTAIVAPPNSLYRYNTGAELTPTGHCRSSDGGASILATGSDASACWSMEGSRLGTPTVTDGTSATVWLQASIGAAAGNHAWMAGANLPSGSTVEVHFGTFGSQALSGSALKCEPNDLWVYYEPTLASGVSSWGFKITLPSPQVIEVPFVGVGGFELDELEFTNPGIFRGYSMVPQNNVVAMGPGPGGNVITREHPKTWQQRVRFNATHEDTDAQEIFDAIQGLNFHRPALTILDTSDVTKYGSCAFGRVSSITPFGMDGRGPSWGVDFNVEHAR